MSASSSSPDNAIGSQQTLPRVGVFQGLWHWARHPISLGLGWIATTLSAAAIGAYATSYFDRPKPDIAISDIRLSPALNAVLQGSVPASVASDPFFSDVQRSSWLKDVETDDPAKASDELKEDDETAREMVQDMTTFRDAYPELVALTRSEDSQANAEAFFDKWATVDQYIYGVLQGHIHRGLFSPPDLKTYPETSRRLILDTPVRGESKYGLVHKIGGMHDSTMALTDDRIPERYLLEIASSLAYFDRPVLRQYLDEVRKDSEELPETQRLMDEIAAYKGGYSRLSISVLVSNAGAKAISFSPDAVLYVNTAEAAGFEDNLPINIALFDEKGNLNPVTVNAGETKLLTFTSKTLVLNMTNWKSLLALFNQSARGCFMAIRSEGDEWGQNKILLSGNRQFGAVTAKDALTPAQIAAHFPQR